MRITNEYSSKVTYDQFILKLNSANGTGTMGGNLRNQCALLSLVTEILLPRAYNILVVCGF